MNETRVLGIDPGSRFTGYGIVEEKDGKLVSIAFDTIKIPTLGGFAIRLKEIYRSITAVIEQYQPLSCAVETLFFAKNVRSVMKLGESRGAALTAVANKDLQVFEYSPTEIKRAIVGYGRSEKEQIQKMVFLLLGLKGETSAFDASDALAVAVCHIHSRKFKQTLFKQGVLYDRPAPR